MSPFKRLEVRVLVRQEHFDFDTSLSQLIDHRQQRPGATRAKIDESFRVGMTEEIAEKRYGRSMQTEDMLDELEIVGGAVANDPRKPREILELEEMDPGNWQLKWSPN